MIYDPLRPEEARLPLGSTLRFGRRTLVVAGALAVGMALFFLLFFLMMVLFIFL